ncbi:MAG: class I SAM-dependent DNA methyltransferase [Peptoniphilaceae bacterium]
MIYGNFADLYDTLMVDFDYDKVYNFILNQFEKSNKEVNKILELGCGTGILTEKLEKNYEVIGLDSSIDMLSIAEQKLRNSKAKLIKADMRDFDFNTSFNAVISTCDSINYILEEKEILNLFKRIFTHLDDDGLFIFDLNTNNKFLNMEEAYVDEIKDIFYVLENFYDQEKEINTYSVNFFVNKDGYNYNRFYEEHIERAYEKSFIVDTLRKVGFKKIDVFNEYEYNKDIEEADRLVYIAWR